LEFFRCVLKDRNFFINSQQLFFDTISLFSFLPAELVPDKVRVLGFVPLARVLDLNPLQSANSHQLIALHLLVFFFFLELLIFDFDVRELLYSFQDNMDELYVQA